MCVVCAYVKIIPNYLSKARRTADCFRHLWYGIYFRDITQTIRFAVANLVYVHGYWFELENKTNYDDADKSNFASPVTTAGWLRTITAKFPIRVSAAWTIAMQMSFNFRISLFSWISIETIRILFAVSDVSDQCAMRRLETTIWMQRQAQ